MHFFLCNIITIFLPSVSAAESSPSVPLDVVLFCHFVRQLDVGIAVTEASHVCHLSVWELQQSSSVFILHLHDVKDALHTLMKREMIKIRSEVTRHHSFTQNSTFSGMRKHWWYLFCAALDVLGGKEGQLFEVGILRPHGLGDHLRQLHGCQRRTQPAVTGQDVHAGLDQTDRLTSTTETWVDYTHTGIQSRNVLRCLFLQTLLKISSVSDCSSALSCILERWACSSRFVFTWGSLNLGLFSLWGTFCASWKSKIGKDVFLFKSIVIRWSICLCFC